MTKPTKTGPSEVDPKNVQAITKDQMQDADKAEFKAHMRHYEKLYLASYGKTKSGVFKKSPLPTPKQVTFSADPDSLQDMMTKAMHHILIDQAKVFANMVQNSLIEALNKGAEGGYLGPAYFQPNQTPPVFQQVQSATPLIDDPTVKVVPSSQAAPSYNANTVYRPRSDVSSEVSAKMSCDERSRRKACGMGFAS
jgi:hypothetical protein